MTTHKTRGFTLIELLVVIAIIGILSAVVLASLNSARRKGNDASVKSNLDTIRTQSIVYYDSTTTPRYFTANYAATSPAVATGCNDYNGLLNDQTVKNALTQANRAAGGSNTAGSSGAAGSFANGTDKVACGWTLGGSAWVIAASTTGAGGNWCIDSTGVSKQETASASIVTSCP